MKYFKAIDFLFDKHRIGNKNQERIWRVKQLSKNTPQDSASRFLDKTHLIELRLKAIVRLVINVKRGLARALPAFSLMWLLYSYGFLIVWEFFDGFTTKIGLDLGLTEVGTYSKVVLSDYGFWGLMAWKYSIIAALGAMYFLVYYAGKKYGSARLKIFSKILTATCLVLSLASVQTVVSNILQIELALHYY